MYKYVDPKEIAEKTGLAYPHTAHCLASGEILVSCLGDEEGNAKGNGFLLLDSDFNIKNRSLITKLTHYVLLSFLSLLIIIVTLNHYGYWGIMSGGRKKDIVPCLVMTSGINRGTRQ